jgi:hypothetical protein
MLLDIKLPHLLCYTLFKPDNDPISLRCMLLLKAKHLRLGIAIDGIWKTEYATMFRRMRNVSHNINNRITSHEIFYLR